MTQNETPNETIGDALIALVRLIAPMTAGYLLSLIALAGVDLPEGAAVQLHSLFAALFSAVYYALIRFLSARWRWVGWLLGYPTNPTYAPTPGSRRARRLAAKRSSLTPRSPPE